MDRRTAFKAFAGGAAAGMFTLGESREAFAQVARAAPNAAASAQDQVRRGLPPLKITDIKVYRLAVGNQNLCVCKVFTSEPGLYGVGDGNHAERPLLVAETIDKYIKPFVVGRNVDEIEKIWQELWVAPYWRASVDANNAMSAVDGALWDIMGKRAGMPVHDLLGGKVRDGLRMMKDIQSPSPQAMEDAIRAGMADGYEHFRIYLGGGGGEDAAAPRPGAPPRPANAAGGPPKTNDGAYINQLCKAFEYIRDKISWDIDIGHDVHEKPSPQGALVLAKAVEKYRPFFIEDLFAPEDSEWYKVVRQQSGIGIAMGELFVNQNEWLPLVSNRLIDFMRMHISAGGGLSLARKVAHCCEFFGVRTAWHGPTNVSPIGHTVNLHLDLSIFNFGICEGREFNAQYQELFPGCPEIRRGVRYANGQPGLGIDINEKVIAKYPPIGDGSNRGAKDSEGAPSRP